MNAARFTHYCPDCDLALHAHEVDRVEYDLVCGVCDAEVDEYVKCDGCDNHAAGRATGYCSACDEAFARQHPAEVA